MLHNKNFTQKCFMNQCFDNLFSYLSIRIQRVEQLRKTITELNVLFQKCTLIIIMIYCPVTPAFTNLFVY